MQWLERQRQKLLPVDYFMVTFTVPYELRYLAQQYPETVYNALFTCASSTLTDFGINDKTLGASMGMTAVLHTHSRRLEYHPHLHVIVPGGGVDKAKRQWPLSHIRVLRGTGVSYPMEKEEREILVQRLRPG